MVKGNVCSENMGRCDAQCQSRCDRKHRGATSSCNGAICQCFYQCKAPPKCNIGMGMCSFKCNDQCCNAKCAAKYPGRQAGYGYCNEAVPNIRLCQCIYTC